MDFGKLKKKTSYDNDEIPFYYFGNELNCHKY